MLKKIALAAGIASIALMPALATPKEERATREAARAAAAAAAEAAEATGEAAAAEVARDSPVEIKPLNVEDVPAVMAYDAPPAEDVGMAPYDPFKEFRDIALKKPLVELSAPDAARLALADQVMAKLMADGTYKRIMDSTQDGILQPLLDRVWNMKAKEFADLFGMKDMPADKKDETFGQAFGKDDPYAKQRAEAFMHVYFNLVGKMAGAVEPDVRKAMARDFARKFDAKQLADINTFLSTPSGSAFAQNYMLSSISLDVLQTSLMVWPKMLDAVPDFAKQLKNADADLPPRPQPSYAIVATDEYTPECAKDGNYGDCTEDDWANADKAVKEKERAEWSKKDRAAVEKAEAQLAQAQDALNAQYDKVDTAREAADRLINDARTNAGQPAPAYAPPIITVAPPPPVAAPSSPQ